MESTQGHISSPTNHVSKSTALKRPGVAASSLPRPARQVYPDRWVPGRPRPRVADVHRATWNTRLASVLTLRQTRKVCATPWLPVDSKTHLLSVVNAKRWAQMFKRTRNQRPWLLENIVFGEGKAAGEGWGMAQEKSVIVVNIQGKPREAGKPCLNKMARLLFSRAGEPHSPP